MAMIDHYRPKGGYACPVCGEKHRSWWGYDSEGLMLFWEEGYRHPLGTELPEECVDDMDQFLESLTLPEEFTIYGHGCECPYPTVLICYCEEGLWNRCEMFTGSEEDRRFVGAETRQQYKARMKWLDGK